MATNNKENKMYATRKQGMGNNLTVNEKALLKIKAAQTRNKK